MMLPIKIEAVWNSMKKSVNLILFVIFWTLISVSGFTQDPLNTDIRFSNLSRNPALAGLFVDELQLNFCYHHQIKTYLLPYQSIQFQIEARYRNKESEDGFTAGALIRYDEVGDNKLKRAQFLPVLNFHKSLSEINISYLSMGFMTGVFKTQFDPFTLPTIKNYHPIPFNPSTPVPQNAVANSSSYVDFSTGISFYTELTNNISFNVGAALFHFSQNLLNQNTFLPKMPREWVINNGVYLKNTHYSLQLLNDLRINKNETLLYSVFILGIPINQHLLNQFSEIQLGANVNSNKEFSPFFSIKCPDLISSLSYHFLIGNQMRLPILQNSFETNFALNINCHRRNNESEKMRCNK